MEKKTILVVDDEEIICDLLARTLTRLGHSAIITRNGRQAVETYQQKHCEIDLAIVDVYMPEMDGWETMTRIKALHPGAIVLLSSGQNEGDTKTPDDKIEADGFLTKPYRVSQLEEAIRQACDKPAVNLNNNSD